MRIVLATPLYPPEIAPVATYAKELARRLSLAGHKINVLAYTHLPEQLQNVNVTVVDKHKPRLVRLHAFRKALIQSARDTDAIIVINGISTELPLILTPLHKKTIFCIADKKASSRLGIIDWLATIRTDAVIKSTPEQKPEILPLETKPVDAINTWNASWNEHLEKIETTLEYDN
ncbi:MAG TPA: hypothetical protein ENJ75_00365 [Candidatus Kaiserbacteria bacterium]|nr:hypothetical protein [Candidatus Kaiserbacteria bacterium]